MTNKRRRFSKVTNQQGCFKEEGRFFPFVRSDLCPFKSFNSFADEYCLALIAVLMRTLSSRISATIVFWTKREERRKMALLTPLLAFLYHLPQVYKWLLKPYYIASLFMSSAFLLIRKTPGVCEHLSTQREDGNSCDFDWVCIKKTFGVSCWMITHITCFVTRGLGSGHQMRVYRIWGWGLLFSWDGNKPKSW